MKLSGTQYKQLQEALLAAFPTQSDLEQMVSFELGENLNVIAGGRNLSAVVFNLIGWAEARGRTQELVSGALRANSGNPALKAIAEHSGIAPSTTSANHSVPGQSSGDQVGGDKTSVGNISDASGVAIGQGAQVNVTHNHYYDRSSSNEQPSPSDDEPPVAGP